MEMPLVIYEQSAVAFIDILGFKNALRDKAKARGILCALSQIKDKVEEHYLDPLRVQFQGVFDVEVTACSDSIAISGPESGAIVVLFTALKFSQLLIEREFLCRGAIVCGALYHKNGVIFGTGLVEAQKCEKHQAMYPRIILDNHTLEVIEKSKNAPNDFAGLIRRDNDGREFLNVLYQAYDTNKHLKSILSELVQMELLINQAHPDVVQKLNWLKNKYVL